MALPLSAIEQAVVSTLQNNAGVGAASNGVYTRVSPRAQAPYVQVGDATLRDRSNLANRMFECSLAITLATRSREEGEAASLLSLVDTALHEVSVSISGYTLFGITTREAKHYKRTDGTTNEARLDVQLMLQENA